MSTFFVEGNFVLVASVWYVDGRFGAVARCRVLERDAILVLRYPCFYSVIRQHPYRQFASMDGSDAACMLLSVAVTQGKLARAHKECGQPVQHGQIGRAHV